MNVHGGSRGWGRILERNHVSHAVQLGDEVVRAVIEDLKRENEIFRRLLFAVDPSPDKVSDHGELLARFPGRSIDYRCDSAESIESAIEARSLEWLREAQWHVCSECGVTRMTYEASQPCRAANGHRWVHPVTEDIGGNA